MIVSSSARDHSRERATAVARIAGAAINACFASAVRLHAFDLAEQLYALGCLQRFYTGYPAARVSGVPRSKVAALPWLVAPMLLLNKYGFDHIGRRFSDVATASFDRWVSSRLEECQVFHFLSSYGLRAQRVSKQRYGAISVCDHGSTHILHQDAIMAAEYARWGLPRRPLFSEAIIERELQEYEEADFILVPSAVAYRSFLDRGFSTSKLRKVPYGVNLQLFRPVPKEDDVFRVIYVGMLNLRKGIPYLLDAVATLRLPKFEVWLVGLPYDEVRSFLRKHEGSFRAFGYLPKDQLHRYYSQASVFVIASVEEGLATVQAQAMACGLPVIATHPTGAEDLFRDGVEGYIVPPRDPEAIREKVLHLYHHPELREEMGRAALRRVREMRGWNAYGEAVVSTYREAIARRNGS